MKVQLLSSVLATCMLLAGCSSAADVSGSSEETRSPSTSGQGSASGSSEEPELSSPSPSATPVGPVTFEDVISDGKLTTAGICATYDKKIKTYAAAAENRLSGGRGQTGNAYVAADYRRSHSWVKDPLAKRFSQSMTASATSALNIVSDGRAGTVEEIKPYLEASLAACGLDTAFSKAQKSVAASVALGVKIRAKANAKPWYPRGYESYDSDLAIRWIDNAGVDCFSRCWYWTMEVISRSGCPSGVYGEMGIERGGTAVAWTNDTLSYLRPGQKGRMQFVTYDDAAYGGTGRLGELNCY